MMLNIQEYVSLRFNFNLRFDFDTGFGSGFSLVLFLILVLGFASVRSSVPGTGLGLIWASV